MKIVIQRSTFVRGQAFAASPEPVDLPESVAKELIVLGKAVEAKPEPVEAPKVTVEEPPAADLVDSAGEAASADADEKKATGKKKATGGTKKS